MQKIVTTKFLPGIIWFVFVLILICIPGQEFPTVDTWFDLLFIDKWIHAFLFGMLAFLFMMPFLGADITINSKKHYLFRIALGASIWGLTTEFIQRFYIPHRSFDLLDWAADSLGILIAYIFSRKKILK